MFTGLFLACWTGRDSRGAAGTVGWLHPLLHAQQPGGGDRGPPVRLGGVAVCSGSRRRSPPLRVRRLAHGHADEGGLLLPHVQKGRKVGLVCKGGSGVPNFRKVG